MHSSARLNIRVWCPLRMFLLKRAWSSPPPPSPLRNPSPIFLPQSSVPHSLIDGSPPIFFSPHAFSVNQTSPPRRRDGRTNGRTSHPAGRPKVPAVSLQRNCHLRSFYLQLQPFNRFVPRVIQGISIRPFPGCRCCCLPLMPQLACSILATWEIPCTWKASFICPFAFMQTWESAIVAAETMGDFYHLLFYLTCNRQRGIFPFGPSFGPQSRRGSWTCLGYLWKTANFKRNVVKSANNTVLCTKLICCF